MKKVDKLIKRIKEVQLRGNTHPRNVFLLEEIVEYLQSQPRSNQK